MLSVNCLSIKLDIKFSRIFGAYEAERDRIGAKEGREAIEVAGHRNRERHLQNSQIFCLKRNHQHTQNERPNPTGTARLHSLYPSGACMRQQARWQALPAQYGDPRLLAMPAENIAVARTL